MEKDAHLPDGLQEPLRRMMSEAERGNEMIRHFFESGEEKDLELLISWLRNHFLKPILYGLDEETTSRARLENRLTRLRMGAARFREVTFGVTTANKMKFVERWNNEVDAAISQIEEKLKGLEGPDRQASTPD